MRTVGAFEAKTNLSKLLRDVEETGQAVVIRRHNRNVARLVPYVRTGGEDHHQGLDLVAAFDELRGRQPAGGGSLRDLVREGRKR